MNHIKFNEIALETLESRLVPTTFSLSEPGLILSVDASKDVSANISIKNNLVINYNTNQSYYFPSNLTGIRINGSQTSDRIDASEFTLDKVFLEISGGQGNDTIYGSPQSDIIKGDSGNDRIYGMDGNDFLYGNDGNDIINGGMGYDIIWGGKGNDNLTAGEISSKVYEPLKYLGTNKIIISGQLDQNSETKWGNQNYNFTITNYRGDLLYGEEGDDFLIGRVDNSKNTKHGVLLVGGLGNDFFDGMMRKEELWKPQECYSIVVDYTMFYKSKTYTTKPIYAGAYYEQIAIRTLYINSFTENPLVWRYGMSFA